MNKVNMYSIFDKAAGTFNSPVCCVSDAVAIRMLRETLADMSTILARYPDDYQLVKVGEFIVDNGQVNPCACLLVDGFRSLLPSKEGGSCGGNLPPEVAERPVSPVELKIPGQNSDQAMKSEPTTQSKKPEVM